MTYLVLVKTKLFFFADDTTIYVEGQDSLALQDTRNQELTHVSDWITSNKLSINYSKTIYMRSHTLLSHSTPIPVSFKDTGIQKVITTKFHGINIDSILKWK